jgi:hypothetical protein
MNISGACPGGKKLLALITSKILGDIREPPGEN